MPRFAILTHDHPFLHWDLLLEDDVHCRTWRLLASPEQIEQAIPAEALPNHRLIYLDYEGPISGDRGSVTLWDSGDLEWRTNNETVCEVVVTGERWRGTVRLIRGEDTNWTCYGPE